MDILSKVIESVTKNFHKSVNEYNLNELFSYGVINDFNHYINMIKCIDYNSVNFSINMYKEFINKIEDNFFNSSYRKQFCEVINYKDTRDLWTLFGNVVFKRRYYYDKLKNRKFYFVDEVLMLPKGLRFDPFVCAKVCECASYDSYAKAGRTVSELIGRRLKFYEETDRYLINRATARNIVHRFKIPKLPYVLRDTPKILYVMLDEKWVHSQFNNGLDHMVKAAVVFEDIDVVYKTKKASSKYRYKLLGKYVLASIDNDLHQQVLDYIYYSYETENLKEIVFMGDCALWVKNFKDGFKYHPDLKITFSIDGYHYSQAIQHICTNKYEHLINSFKEAIMDNDRKTFINLCKVIVEFEPHRKETVEEKQNYILNNWKFIQNYYHKVCVKCSMEAHISHCFADIFTSRPRAYSTKGLRQLLKLRLLKCNGIDIQKTYFEVLNKEYEDKNILDLSYSSSTNPKTTYEIKQKLNCYSDNNQILLC